MFAAITTKFLGPTNHRGSRIKASCSVKSVIAPWDYSLGVSQNHAQVAAALAVDLGWAGEWYGGDVGGSGYAFVCNTPSGLPVFVVPDA